MIEQLGPYGHQLMQVKPFKNGVEQTSPSFLVEWAGKTLNEEWKSNTMSYFFSETQGY